ncbi:phenylacetic acid degradation operon negative regulatory protein PaaX [Janthinobacterium agaricidamnosum]|uniref:Phenylacetic acid degradation operon negative regulatory protein PaaX n=1 Tax=Janthinobacterium agaricidamnosum NBRC 102515 = DSM 9628 TaxID=1349767 RepID=W0V1T1_9BURK|nr:phenylacetic acid degradation operon negative regulatory protein PaaX [Janthinobacterium agaricidamnosum]CDG81293.1 phenylacetic acid degradation operon negative regulatory protein PaaX [Janthinobacterium agaricidamnosum NBRC 102515 = DSM 9628]
MKNTPCNEWIAQFLASDPPRSKSLVTTIFGDAIVPHGGLVWLGSLIELLAPFGVNDRLLRTSVFRLAQEGWLGASRDGRRSAYAVTPEALGRFMRALRRIYAPLVLHWDGSWTLVMGPAGSIDAAERSSMRKEMLWEGYSAIGPGLFGHPAGDPAVLEDMLQRNGVQGKLYICQAKELPGVSQRPLREMVADCWDLSGVIHDYRRFIVQFQPLLALLETDSDIAPEQAFVVRSLLIHAYRRVQLHDPQLPVELLPDPWPGAQAYALVRAIYRLIYRAAEEHIMTTLRREDAQSPAAEASFYQRFGGLLA